MMYISAHVIEVKVAGVHNHMESCSQGLNCVELLFAIANVHFSVD